MNDDELNEIRTRNRRAVPNTHAESDVETLLAEVERLRAELAQAKADAENWRDKARDVGCHFDIVVGQRDHLQEQLDEAREDWQKALDSRADADEQLQVAWAEIKRLRTLAPG